MERIHHSDVIGSLLRPRYLTQARDEYAAGQLGAPAFKRIEDRAVDEAIELQEGIGLDEEKERVGEILRARPTESLKDGGELPRIISHAPNDAVDFSAEATA